METARGGFERLSPLSRRWQDDAFTELAETHRTNEQHVEILRGNPRFNLWLGLRPTNSDGTLVSNRNPLIRNRRGGRTSTVIVMRILHSLTVRPPSSEVNEHSPAVARRAFGSCGQEADWQSAGLRGYPCQPAAQQNEVPRRSNPGVGATVTERWRAQMRSRLVRRRRCCRRPPE
jgi:hypothetical protein